MSTDSHRRRPAGPDKKPAKPASGTPAIQQVWWVYFLCCADGSLYCGIATDLVRRVKEHNDSPKSAKYTRSRRPVKLVWQEKQSSRSAALKREYQLKLLPRAQKKLLLQKRPKKR